ncbi:MAG: helix-turn-helix domain-containing protein [Cytophagales bacterium]|nr:helix-turn-helix domain-containing protein [Cytophagales bacterium]
MGVLLSSQALAADQADTTFYKTTFIIEQLPSTTPHDASIYLAGSAWGWYPDIEANKFVRNDKGQFQLTVTHAVDTFQYKFTRGSWKAVEGRSNGRARPNRHFELADGHVILVTIDSWEDISIGSYVVYMFALLISALQGILLIIAINTIRNKNKKANGTLSIVLLLISLSLLGRASTFDPSIFNWQPRLILVPELLLFTYGPLFYYYVHKLLVIDFNKRLVPLHAFLFVVQFGLYIPYLTINNQTFIYRLIDKELFPIFAITGLVALLFNVAYWFFSRQLIIQYTRQESLNENQKKYTRFLNGILRIKAIYLIVWALTVIIYAVGEATDYELLFVVEQMIDVLWLIFSFIIFALAYYAVKHPEVLREKQKYKDQSIKKTELDHILERLEVIMQEDKAFLDPSLTLNSLAYLVPTSTHMLSQVINEQFNKSYNDYVNGYRINEFITLAKVDDQESFLSLAFQVGFGSKPTFNRAFKKLKGKTPKEYFKEAV